VTPSTHIWDVLIPGLVILTIGGAVTFFVWKSFQGSSGALSGGEGPPENTKWEPKRLRRLRGKPRLMSRTRFLRETDHGNDLYVDDED
jgi:hypothetical protein